MKRILAFIVASSLCAPATAEPLSADDVVDALVSGSSLPRPLNSVDVPELPSNDPQPMLIPEGDFNRDGRPDLAISGIYQLPPGAHRYFLLVGTWDPRTRKYRALFMADYPKPVFLHKAGTTGRADPGDQAFSASFCSNCEEGLDFYWEKGAFRTSTWKARIERLTQVEQVPAEEVDPAIVDRALKIVGFLPDVTRYVEDLKSKGKPFGVRVRRARGGPDRYDVKIFEKGEAEKEYDVVTVDLKKSRIVKRKRKD